MTESTINIRPGVRMLELFASLPYKEWYAIGELVDNALQSYLANKDRLRGLHGDAYVLQISIVIEQEGSGRITVSDNAAGISGHDWERAMRVAVPPDDTKGLSQFGVGLKAAACWFSRVWDLESSALGENVSRMVTVDVDATVRTGAEELELLATPKDPLAHGTVVTMRSLRRKPWGMGIRRIKDHLTSIYREFLRDGDVEILYNGEPIVYADEPVLYATVWDQPDSEPLVWKREFDAVLVSGRAISGWLAVRSRGKQSAAGLALLYRRKVIVGAGDSRYKPERIFGAGTTFRSQRLMGEVDVSDFDVSHTKDSLLWGDEEDEVIDLILSVLREPTMPMLAQVDNYRPHKPDPIPQQQLAATAERIRRILVEVEADPDPGRVAAPAPKGTTYLDERGVDLEADFDTLIDGEPVTVRIQLVREPGDKRWLWHVESANVDNRMRVVVNRSHPFMRKYCEAPVQDLESVWLIGLAIVLGAKQGQKRGSRMTNLVVEGVNDYVRRFSN